MIARSSTLLAAACVLVGTLSAQAQSLNFGPPFLVEGGLDRPFGLAVSDSEGTLVLADTGNHSFKTVAIADLTGSYTFIQHGLVADRTDPAALTAPMGVATDGADVYVADTRGGRVLRYVHGGGSYTLDTNFASSNPTSVDGTPIDLPRDLAVAPDGAVYLLDSGNNRILKADGPTDTTWSVHHSGADWSNPYGLDIDAGGAIYVADTGNHRVVKIDGATVTTFGGWGEGNGQFRFPRDVAVDQHGRLFVADTFNHRIQVLAADGHHLRNLGHAPAFGMINKVEVDGSDRIYAVDSDANRVIAYLGAGQPASFDPYFRNYVGDDGAEPSTAEYLISSPDIIVRHAPDIDLDVAAASGLESFAFQQPKFGEMNYVYVAVNNRGTQTATDNFIKLYWYDPGSPGHFPEDWSGAGFFRDWAGPGSNQPSNILAAPVIEPGGRVVIGPLLWRPPAPETALAGDGLFRLGARLSNPFDQPPVGSSVTMPRDSNNVTERRVTVLRGPFAEGVQNTLVLRVHFPDIAQSTDEATIVSRVNQLDAWVNEVSWGLASVTPVYRGPVIPDEPSIHYDAADATTLIELAEDVLAKQLLAEPGVLDGAEPGEEITRIILVTNDLSEVDGWALSSAWPYLLNGETRYLTVSVHGAATELPAYAHGMSRQFGMQDLFAHSNVTFSQAYVDGWDNMARPHQGAHPLVWSKELANWVSLSDADVRFVPRPDPGVTWDNGGDPVHLFRQASQTGEDGPIAVAFGLTHGITNFVDETAFFYVEARDPADPGAPADSVLPGSGVIMYYANRQIPTGQGPVILRDHVPGGDLSDAPIPVGASEAPGGTGLEVRVLAGTDGADFNLDISYTPPTTDYDVYMERGDPPWQSPDIWVDNQADGYDEDEGRAPQDRGDLGIADEENRVYAKVRNQGPATAHDVEVAFLFSEPYHTVGGQGAFDEFRTVFLSTVPGSDTAITHVDWTPARGVNPHTCARVELRRLFNDTNPENDWAQRNLEIDHSVHGSPYTPVSFPFSFRNEEDRAELIYFRADGIPRDWSWSISPHKALVPAGAQVQATLNLQPPEGAEDCTEHPVHVTGWAARSNTLVRIGGATVRVDLRQAAAIDVKTRLNECRREDLDRLARERKKAEARGEVFIGWDGERQQCLRTVTVGCTNPKVPNTEITIRYEGPDGVPVYKTVTTDANGCYEDFNVVVEGGEHGVQVTYPGDDCLGPATGEVLVEIPLDPVDRPEPTLPDGDARHCVSGLSLDVEGRIEDVRPSDAKESVCKVGGIEQEMRLKVSDTGLFGDRMKGEIAIRGLGSLHSPRHDAAGYGTGLFQWKGDGFHILGDVAGIYGIGGSRLGTADCTDCREGPDRPGHWELQLRGTVIKGRNAGAIVRATLVLDADGADLRGAVEGSVERLCSITKATQSRRITAEWRAADQFQSPTSACGGSLGCLSRISKSGKGEALMMQRGEDKCRDARCGASKTWEAVTFLLVGDPAQEDSGPLAGDGELIVADFVDVTGADGTGRGHHGGAFVLRTKSGTEIVGEIRGTTADGSHRAPGARDLTKHLEKGRYVGQMTGTVRKGEDFGARVEARYQIQMREQDGRHRRMEIALDGWLAPSCDARQMADDPPRRRLTGAVAAADVLARLLALRDARVAGAQQTEPEAASRDAETPEPARPDSINIIALPREELPKGLVRSLDELPREAVWAFVKAEGGRLDAAATRRLQLADFRFRALSNGGEQLSLKQFESLYKVGVLGGNNEAGAGRALADWYLRKYDRDRDDRLDRREFGPGWDRFGALDKNGDNSMSRAELARVHKLIVKEAFGKADLDGNEQIDFREFALWWRELS